MWITSHMIGINKNNKITIHMIPTPSIETNKTSEINKKGREGYSTYTFNRRWDPIGINNSSFRTKINKFMWISSHMIGSTWINYPITTPSNNRKIKSRVRYTWLGHKSGNSRTMTLGNSFLNMGSSGSPKIKFLRLIFIGRSHHKYSNKEASLPIL